MRWEGVCRSPCPALCRRLARAVLLCIGLCATLHACRMSPGRGGLWVWCESSQAGERHDGARAPAAGDDTPCMPPAPRLSCRLGSAVCSCWSAPGAAVCEVECRRRGADIHACRPARCVWCHETSLQHPRALGATSRSPTVRDKNPVTCFRKFSLFLNVSSDQHFQAEPSFPSRTKRTLPPVLSPLLLLSAGAFSRCRPGLLLICPASVLKVHCRCVACM